MKVKLQTKEEIETTNMITVKINENKTKNDFLKYIRKHQDNVVGVESYGEESEFYDEDGCVLFITKPNEQYDAIVFMFPETNEEFLFKIIEP